MANGAQEAGGWKAPGPDCLPAFWLRAFPQITEKLKQSLWDLMDGTVEIPEWLVCGRTVMIPKEGCVGRPDQFKPIACLNTTYKLLTGVAAEMLTDHVTRKGMLPWEQKALRRKRRGCLDALVVDRAVVREAQNDRRDLSVAWVDYRKAFDMVPHKWLRRVLKAVRAPKMIRRLLQKLVPLWRTDVVVHTDEGEGSFRVEMERGVFQVSPLLYCLCVAPLSYRLRRELGFQSQHNAESTTHLMFVDDLKVFAESGEELDDTLGVVEEISEAMGFELGRHGEAGSTPRRKYGFTINGAHLC